jgi:hypothetical protein
MRSLPDSGVTILNPSSLTRPHMPLYPVIRLLAQVRVLAGGHVRRYQLGTTAFCRAIGLLFDPSCIGAYVKCAYP